MSFRVDLDSFLKFPWRYWRERRTRALTQEALAFVSLGADRTPGYEASLALWLLKSKDHVAVWLDVTAFYEEAARSLHYPELGTIAVAVQDQQPPAPRASVPASSNESPLPRRVLWFRRPAVAWALAASVVLMIAAGVWAYRPSATAIEYATNIGEYRTFTLDDGTLVKLNTNSRIEVSFTADARIVDLLKGEALFDIAHDARPFRVRSAGTVIEDIGTQFHVRLEADHLNVAVIEGEVKIGSIPLSAGQRVTLTRTARPFIESADEDELARQLAWTHGMVQFRGETLSDAVREINRYNVRKMEIADAELGSLRIGGQFSASNPGGFARALRTLGVRTIEPEPGARASEPIRLMRSNRQELPD